MRKYFLLSAVALLATSTANATTDYAEVTAKATIEHAGTLDCPSEWDFGTIVIKPNNEALVIDDGDSTSSDFIQMSGGGERFMCDEIGVYANDYTIALTNNGNDFITLDIIKGYEDEVSTEFWSKLTLEENTSTGEYVGNFRITKTY